MDSEPQVATYMTRAVTTVAPTDTVADVRTQIGGGDGHNGFPVSRDGHVEGFVTGRDLFTADPGATVAEVMSEEPIVADPTMSITDAARVILRSDIQKLPVVDDGELVGILSNTDVIRSQIERATPEKVAKLSRTLTEIHGVELTQERQQIPITELVPTQAEVYGDELDGRRYELERGLAEPLVVIDAGGDGGETYLADGHHRVLAADRLGIDKMDAYLIVPAEPLELGMAQTAAEQGLSSIADITVIEQDRHPLVEKTTQLQE